MTAGLGFWGPVRDGRLDRRTVGPEFVSFGLVDRVIVCAGQGAAVIFHMFISYYMFAR